MHCTYVEENNETAKSECAVHATCSIHYIEQMNFYAFYRRHIIEGLTPSYCYRMSAVRVCFSQKKRKEIKRGEEFHLNGDTKVTTEYYTDTNNTPNVDESVAFQRCRRAGRPAYTDWKYRRSVMRKP